MLSWPAGSPVTPQAAGTRLHKAAPLCVLGGRQPHGAPWDVLLSEQVQSEALKALLLGCGDCGARERRLKPPGAEAGALDCRVLEQPCLGSKSVPTRPCSLVLLASVGSGGGLSFLQQDS